MSDCHDVRPILTGAVTDNVIDIQLAKELTRLQKQKDMIVAPQKNDSQVTPSVTHQSETTASMTGSHSKLSEYPIKVFKKS